MCAQIQSHTGKNNLNGGVHVCVFVDAVQIVLLCSFDGKWCAEGNSKCLVELYFGRCYNITLANIELLKSVL